MKRAFWILIAALLVFTGIDANAQRWKLRRYELDMNLSGVAFHGDIGRANRPIPNMFNGFRPSLGITPRFMIRQDLAVSLDLGWVMYGGQDVQGETHSRVYSFNSQAFQHFARLEYYLLGVRRSGGAIYNRKGMVNNYNKMYLYVLAGAGGIMSKSTIKDQDGVELLDNPGYDNTLQYTAGFPVGGGIKLSIDPRWSIGLELSYNFTLSDWLDGYSKEGLSEYLDTYYLLSFKAIYKVRNNRKGRPIFNKYYR
ncbi:MAG: hypothetical protein ABFS10_13750 [Bacteroidota bacterium]